MAEKHDGGAGRGGYKRAKHPPGSRVELNARIQSILGDSKYVPLLDPQVREKLMRIRDAGITIAMRALSDFDLQTASRAMSISGLAGTEMDRIEGRAAGTFGVCELRVNGIDVHRLQFGNNAKKAS